MKRIVSILFSDPYIARGPDIGEIYFVGYVQPDGVGIYRSTDFGETAELKDGSGNIECIGADSTPGSVYYSQIYGAMYYSDNYGELGSWTYKEDHVFEIISGRNEGEIFSFAEKHSDDYGSTFINHQMNGIGGYLIEAEIDCQDNIGYITCSDVCPDSIYLYISYDNFDNLEFQHVFDLHCYTDMDLTRGVNDGELYLYTKNMNFGTGKHLYYSSDYGNTWELKNTFNSPNLPIWGIEGGRQPGELYLHVAYNQSSSSTAYNYIYHSLDYGETFMIYNPIAFGNEPSYAHFEASPTTGTAPLAVQFTDLSVGPINYWTWDFENDGVIDSDDQNPVHIYEEPGVYSIKLTIYTPGIGTEREAFRFDYIAVSDSVRVNNDQINVNPSYIYNYPNPVKNNTTFYYDLPGNATSSEILIYNIRGQLVDEIAVNSVQKNVEWRTDKISSGIYFYKLSVGNEMKVKKAIIVK